MTSRYAQLLFTPAVRRHQERWGSRTAYERMALGPRSSDLLGPAEQEFVAERDSFYLASVGESGWPYLQHRGGPPGFLAAVDERTLAFADYRGNRQYITTGNLDHDDRVALFLMDYPGRTRLKILGRARTVESGDDPALAERLRPAGYRAVVERLVVIGVEAFDWNCSQHIRPRFTPDELRAAVAPLQDRLAHLERENAALRARLAAEPPAPPTGASTR